MPDVDAALAALDRLDKQSREDARHNAQPTSEPVSPEQHQHDAARWLADHSSDWTTF